MNDDTHTGNPSNDKGNWYVLTVDLPRIIQPITLTGGVTLRPLREQFSVFDLAAAGAVGFRSWAVLEPMASSCTCEIESAVDANITPGYDTLNRAWLASALLVLRGFTRHMCVACSRYSWSKITGHQKRHSSTFQKQLQQEGVETATFAPRDDLPPFEGQLLDFHLAHLIDKGTRADSISDDDARWIKEHYDIFNILASENDSFRFALEAAIDWRYSSDIRSAVSRLWAGIEAIFGISSELVYRISLLSASLLVQRGEERKKRFRATKELYGLRSKAVHGDEVPTEKLSLALNGSFQLLKELLLLTIDKGHILNDHDFDDAIFGE
ncbi:MAG: hypothetical protein KJ964_02435 [Verrucomicrobia bacterium]|nr:hypothetical protein [Verrucomicrobiota bacterium]MBU1734033.1 hypothetical protein [Verrucomicrobiota bacterium]MBU1857129.1 hypothetical protein [Verrucomicrobiota bacterium]